MERTEPELSRLRRGLLGTLLGAFLLVPPLVVWRGTEGGVAFTLYREPKLAALGLLGWGFVLAFLAAGPRLTAADLRATLRKPFYALFLAFLLWAGAGRAWVRVPENHLYEWGQYLLLFVMAVLLDGWAARDERVARSVRRGLVLALVPLVAVGYLQLAGLFPFVVPIDPGYGVRHPSLMGYKNPMALALGGQLFLLAGVAWEALRSRHRTAIRWLAASYFAAAVLYLATLQSRTAVVATVGAGLGALGLHLARKRRAVGAGRAVAVALLGIVAVGIVVAASPTLRDRFGSLAPHLLRPATLLETDRGVYLRNTLAMVEDRPLGVGLGDWQTWYPVYRRHDRYRAFDERFQVRRAHGDHAQLLGELGWPGLALWWALLGAALMAPIRRFRRRGEPWDLLLAAQVLFFVLAMLGDYVIELPYSKAQLVLVGFLAVSSGASRSTAGGAGERERRPGAAVVAALVVLVAMTAFGSMLLYAELGRRSVAAARLEVAHRTAPAFAISGAAAEEALARRERVGERFLAAPLTGGRPWGDGKTFYRAHLVLAETAALRGETEPAMAALRRALELHPFHPPAFRLCAEILREAAPERAARCAALHDHVLHEATGGFDSEYPPFLQD